MIENEDGAYDDYVVKSIVGNLITFNEKDGVARSPISVTSDVKVYDASGSTPVTAHFSDIQPGYMIKEVSLQDGQYKIIVILEK